MVAEDTELSCSVPPDDHVIVLFGASGDLAARKLLPGFFHLAQVGLMPPGFRIIGTSRKDISTDEFRDLAREAVDQFGRGGLSDDQWSSFSERLSYVASDASDMSALATEVDSAKASMSSSVEVLYYLSIPPMAMSGIVKGLGASGLIDSGAKVILEKPFGTDYDSARALNELLLSVFAEEQVFRIDHFLGKEDVQNILAVRFSNRLFEPVWCATHVANVQIDVPETLGVEGRIGFYEQTGAFKDMVVTHLFQALGFVAMDAPKSFDNQGMAEARQKVFNALELLDPAKVVRGQYVGYRESDQVADDSDTETLIALEARINNERWDGVPIYLRTGKRMPESRRVITVKLKQPTMDLFTEQIAAGRTTDGDELVFEIGEPGSIKVNFQSKEPGPAMVVGPAQLKFSYKQNFDPRCELEAYERLLHDAMMGDRTLFTRAEGIERLWQVAEPLLKSPPPVELYEPDTWGPDSVQGLVKPATWHLPVPPQKAKN